MNMNSQNKVTGSVNMNLLNKGKDYVNMNLQDTDLCQYEFSG